MGLQIVEVQAAFVVFKIDFLEKFWYVVVLKKSRYNMKCRKNFGGLMASIKKLGDRKYRIFMFSLLWPACCPLSPACAKR